MGEVATGLEEIRNATGLFYTKQTDLNSEFEVKFCKLSTDVEEKFGKLTDTIEAKFVELRTELGAKFAEMQGNTAEMQRLMEAMEARKTAMSAEIKETFDKLEEKGTEMETLIDQSGEILRKTTDQVDGALKIVNGTLQQHDVNFQQILGKVTQYDELLSRQRQPQGKGQSSTGKGWQEPQYGLINDKDIKMPMFPDKFDNVEVFRRWWRDTAEYCERSHRFLGITYVF